MLRSRAVEWLKSQARLAPGASVTAMFLYPVSLDGQSLGVGESDAPNVHVDPDLAALFPSNRVNNNDSRTVNVA